MPDIHNTHSAVHIVLGHASAKDLRSTDSAGREFVHTLCTVTRAGAPAHTRRCNLRGDTVQTQQTLQQQRQSPQHALAEHAFWCCTATTEPYTLKSWKPPHQHNKGIQNQRRKGANPAVTIHCHTAQNSRADCKQVCTHQHCIHRAGPDRVSVELAMRAVRECNICRRQAKAMEWYCATVGRPCGDMCQLLRTPCLL